jgi:hypothetical protein
LETSRKEFIVPDGKYSREQFQKVLIEGQDGLFLPSTKHKWIKVHSVRTEPNKWKEVLRQFLQRELGDVWHIQLPISSDVNENVNFYVVAYSPELLLFYSCSTNWQYALSLERFIQETKGFGQMCSSQEERLETAYQPERGGMYRDGLTGVQMMVVRRFGNSRRLTVSDQEVSE